VGEAELRSINAKMLAALRYVLTFLQEGLPATANLDWSTYREMTRRRECYKRLRFERRTAPRFEYSCQN